MSLYPTDSNEAGLFPVTLANQGWIQIYPTGVGDQWHNTSEDSRLPLRPNVESYAEELNDDADVEVTNIYRNGLRMVEVLALSYESDPLTQFSLKTSQIVKRKT